VLSSGAAEGRVLSSGVQRGCWSASSSAQRLPRKSRLENVEIEGRLLFGLLGACRVFAAGDMALTSLGGKAVALTSVGGKAVALTSLGGKAVALTSVGGKAVVSGLGPRFRCSGQRLENTGTIHGGLESGSAGDYRRGTIERLRGTILGVGHW
jgi:hypothetical protein